MITWGYIDFTTGENIVPTEEDMYISDEEDTLSKVDTTYLWQRKHALKKRWNELTHEQRQEIQEDDEDECLRAMAWSGGVDDDLEHWESESEDSDDEAYNINTEIDRNYRVPPQPRNHESMVPAKEDTAAWQELSREMVMTTIPEVSDAEYEKAQAWRNHAKSNIKGEWNLPRYLMGDAFMRSRLVAPLPPLSEGNSQYEEQDDEVYDDDDDDDEDDDDDDDDDDEDEDDDNGEGDNMVDG
ncbi:hypothetical protein NM208_g15671 [Fusarium decemcellulare]|uniref:Uncharacterized protein n=1 Tax=Fusarium decemcellulare TaxID=57161 RepID=A0ACC1RCX7_9HYPO|nr:hypothetical protein NM208_g15671 [Fusarium decemcellulare]